MTSVLPLVCKLLFGVSKGKLPVRHLTPIELMAVNYCGRQLTLGLGWAAPAYLMRLGWAAPAYLIRAGDTPHPGMCKHNLQYVWRPDGCFSGADWSVEYR